MNNERIVFMGTPAFAAHVLEGLLNAGYNIVAVVTQADAPVGRKHVLTPSPVKEVALKHHLALLQPLHIRKEYADVLKYEPDLIITCAYGQIIPSALLNYPRFSCINTHASLLPSYRGGAPIQRAIMAGEKNSGITIMYMNEKMDEGDILYQKSLDIREDDTSTSLFARLSDLALEMLLEYLPLHFKGDIHPLKQDSQKATYAYNLTKDDEHIDFNADVLQVYNHIRALLDNPGAYAMMDGKVVKFNDVSYLRQAIEALPGTFLGLYEKQIAVSAVGGIILFATLQMAGKKPLKAVDFYNGAGKAMVNKRFE